MNFKIENTRKMIAIGYAITLSIFFIFSLPSTKEIQKVKIFMAETNSMAPTIEKDNDVLIDCRIPPDAYQRFDLVCLKSSESQMFSIRRIIGLPFETVSIMKNRIHINGEELEFPETIKALFTSVFRVFPEDTIYILKENEFYLLGDNVAASMDSRYYGPVSVNNLVGRVLEKTMLDYPLLYGLSFFCGLAIVLFSLMSLCPFNLKSGRSLWHWLPVMGISTSIVVFFVTPTSIQLEKTGWSFVLLMVFIIVYAWGVRVIICHWLRGKGSQSTGRLIQAFTITLVGILFVLMQLGWLP